MMLLRGEGVRTGAPEVVKLSHDAAEVFAFALLLWAMRMELAHARAWTLRACAFQGMHSWTRSA